MSEQIKPLEPAVEMVRRMLEYTQQREAVARGAIVQAAYWIDQGASGRALAVLRNTMQELEAATNTAKWEVEKMGVQSGS